jgi:hypothetical protein
MQSNEEQSSEHEERTTLRALIDGAQIGEVDFYEIGRYRNGIDGIEHGDWIGYGDAEAARPIERANAIGSTWLCGSDYVGGSVVRSNLQAMRAILDEIAEEHEAEAPYVNASGGYGTDAVFFLLDVEAPESMLAPIVEALQALESYPVLDEDSLAEIECEEVSDSWESYACSDFASALQERIGSDFVEVEADSDALFGLFNECSGTIEHEESGAWIDVEGAATYVSAPLLFALGFARIDGEQALDACARPNEEDANEARRVLRIAGIGRAMKAISGALAASAERALLWKKKKALGEEANGKPLGYGLSGSALKLTRLHAKEIARQAMLGMEVDAGDLSAPLALDSFDSAPIRSARITVSVSSSDKRNGEARYETRSATVDFDPLAAYNESISRADFDSLFLALDGAKQ